MPRSGIAASSCFCSYVGIMKCIIVLTVVIANLLVASEVMSTPANTKIGDKTEKMLRQREVR